MTLQIRRIAQPGGDWSGAFSIAQTDPALGVVSSGIFLTASVQEIVQVRSLEGAAAFVASTATSAVVLSGPGGPLVTVSPSATAAMQLGAATGGQDGAALTAAATGTDQGGRVSGGTTGPDLAFLTGTGAVALAVTAATRVHAVMPGNVQATVRTQVGAVVRSEVVTRDPPPSGLVGSGTTLVNVPILAFGSLTTVAQTQSLAEARTGRSGLLSFQQFDPALGTPEFATLTLTITGHGTYQAENDTGHAAPLTLWQDAAFSVLRLDGSVMAGATASATATVALGASTAPASGTLVTTKTAEVTVAGADLAQFVGGGTATLAIGGMGTDTIDGPGAFALTTGLTSGLTIGLSYTYLPGGTQAVVAPDPSVVQAGETRVLRGLTPTAVAPGGTLVVTNGMTGPFTVYGTENVLPGGSMIAPQTIKGTLNVAATAHADLATVALGGTVIAEGAINYTTVAGLAVVRGTASQSVVTGTEYVYGQSTGSVVLPGGREIVAGRATSLQLQGGEAQIVAGGAADVRLAAGRVTVESGGNVLALAFAGPGTLTINDGGVAGPITGFAAGDTITLAGVPFSAASSASASAGILTITTGQSGGTSLQVAAPARTNFRLAAAPATGGTAITLEPGLSVGGTAPALATEYRGPVDGIENQFVALSPNTVAGVSTDNWFLHAGGGVSALAAHGGRNVLDAGTGSGFLVGGTGQDTFFASAPTAAPTWTTVLGHAGDDVTLWSFGTAPTSWADGLGAAGYTGLTLITTVNGLDTRLTLAGYSMADLGTGRVTLQAGHDPASGLGYLHLTM